MRGIKHWPAWVLGSLILLACIDRAHLLVEFGFRCTSTDEVIIWQIARDYGQGLFREWYMYGQNYNPMLEALLGSPFLRLGADPWVVLPIVTSCLALLPFWSFALWHFRRGELLAAFGFALMPLLLPVEWGMLTTITRGFVHGIALIALLPWALSLKRIWLRLLIASFITGAALLCNPNSLVFLVAIYTTVVLTHWRELRFWSMSILGTIPALLFWYKAHHFFDDHRWDMMHWIDPGDLHFSPTLLFKAFTQLDSHFAALFPVWWPNGHLALVTLALLAVLLWRVGSRSHALGVFAAIAVILLSLCVVKVHNGCESVFFARSRMFLAIPLLLCWAIGGLLKSRTLSPKLAVGFIVLGLCYVGLKWLRTPEVVDREMKHQQGSQVREAWVMDVFEQCISIGAAARDARVEVVVPVRWPQLRVEPNAHFNAYLLCYACSFAVPDLPPTFGPGYDRRSWVRDRYKGTPAGNVLFVGGDPVAWEHVVRNYPTEIKVGKTTLPLHSFHCDTLTIESLSIRLGIDDDIGR